MKPVPVPSLDEIATGQARRLSELDLATIGALLEECNAVQGALALALLKRQAAERRVASKISVPDTWLTPEQAAKLSQLSPRFFFRHSNCGCARCAGRALNGNALAFVRRVSHRNVRISKLGLEAWLSENHPRR